LIRYIIKRLLWTIPVMLGVLIIVFTITYLTPGDPVKTILGTGYTPAKYAVKAHELGLDKGYFGQIGSYIWNLVTHLSLGKSFTTSIPVTQELAKRIPVTFKIAFLSIIIIVITGLPLGILSATKQYSVLDTSLTSFALVMCAIPAFVLALLALVLFGVKLRWLPISGLHTWQSWILPVATNALGGTAVIMRMTRTTMLEVIRQDYIRTARAKGLKESAIIRGHAMKNCMIPVTTVIGSYLAALLSGAIIVETIFSIPGLGMYLMGGITARDYPVINGTVVLLAFIVCAMNLIVDVIYAFIDPRIRSQYVSPKKKAKAVQKFTGDKAEVA
jgi:peptide/nickel transport system permease protein